MHISFLLKKEKEKKVECGNGIAEIGEENFFFFFFPFSAMALPQNFFFPISAIILPQLVFGQQVWAAEISVI